MFLKKIILNNNNLMSTIKTKIFCPHNLKWNKNNLLNNNKIYINVYFIEIYNFLSETTHTCDVK